MGLELTLRRTQYSSINATIRDKTFLQVWKERGFSCVIPSIYKKLRGTGYLFGERDFLFDEMGYKRKVV